MAFEKTPKELASEHARYRDSGVSDYELSIFGVTFELRGPHVQEARELRRQLEHFIEDLRK